MRRIPELAQEMEAKESVIRFENIFAKVSVELLSDASTPRKGRRRAEFRVTGFLCAL